MSLTTAPAWPSPELSPRETRAIADELAREETPPERREALLSGEAPPVVIKDGQPAMLSETIKRIMSAPAPQTTTAAHVTGAVVDATGASDSQGNTWTQVGTGASNTNSGGAHVHLYYAANCRGGANSVTGTINGAGTIEILVAEYSAVATSSPLDQYGAATGNSPTATVSTSGATSNANDLVVAVAASAGASTVNPGSGYALRETGLLRRDHARGPARLRDWDADRDSQRGRGTRP